MRWLQRQEYYERALAMLERALTFAASRPLSELDQQGLIQAFKFTNDLSWLRFKEFLVDQGMSGISGSRDAVREAVVRELLAPGTESTWMAMIPSRNLTSHTNNPALAEEIARLIALVIRQGTAKSVAKISPPGGAKPMIPGIPQADSQWLLELIHTHPHVQKVVLYGSRALGSQQAGSESISASRPRPWTSGSYSNSEQHSTTCSCRGKSISSYAT